MLNEFGRSVVACSTSIDAAQVELMAGDRAEAERLLRADYDALEAMGEQFVRSTVGVLLARTLQLEGQLDGAKAIATSVRGIAGDDDIDSQVGWRVVLAEVAAATGDAVEAVALATRALELSRETDSPRLQAVAFRALASAHAAAGEDDERAAALASAAALYRSKGDTTAEQAILAD